MTSITPPSPSWPPQPRKGRRACKRAGASHRVAEEIHRIYETLSQLPLFDLESSDPGPALHPLYDENRLRERLDALKGLTGDNQQSLQKAYVRLLRSGPLRTVAQAPKPEVLNDLLDGFPNFASVTEWVQEQLVLCRLSPQASLQLPPVLLDGPPGVGKTAFSQALAERLGVEFERIDLSAAKSSHHLVGVDAGYSSSHPGRIWDSLQRGSLSVTWLLDEIDKIPTDGSDSGAQYLLGLLEPGTANQFTDNWSSLPIDASWIFYVATSNDKDRIDQPLLSRFTVFDIAVPTTAEARQIVGSIYRGFQQKAAWGHVFEPAPTPSVIDTLVGYPPREVRRLLRRAFARCAKAGRRRIEVADIPACSNRGQPRIGFI